MLRMIDPNEWHPFYNEYKIALLIWLDNNVSDIRLPLRSVPGVNFKSEPDPIPCNTKSITLRKNKARGLAPYTGDPFIYEWTVATDHLGRGIATDSKRVYY